MEGTAMVTSDTLFDFGPGTYMHASKVIDCLVEATNSGVPQLLVSTDTSSDICLSILGCSIRQGAPKTTLIDFKSVAGRFEMGHCRVNVGQCAITATFTDPGSVATFDHCHLGITHLSYAGKLKLRDNVWIPGSVTLSSLGPSAELYQDGDQGGGFSP
jgi:hypothetical protein